MENLRASREAFVGSFEGFLRNLGEDKESLQVPDGPPSFDEVKYKALLEEKKNVLSEIGPQLETMCSSLENSVTLTDIHNHLLEEYTERQGHIEIMKQRLGLSSGTQEKQAEKVPVASTQLENSFDGSSEALGHSYSCVEKENTSSAAANLPTYPSLNSWKAHESAHSSQLLSQRELKLSDFTLQAMAAANPWQSSSHKSNSKSRSVAFSPYGQAQEFSGINNRGSYMGSISDTSGSYHAGESIDKPTDVLQPRFTTEDTPEPFGSLTVSLEEFNSLPKMLRSKISFETLSMAITRLQSSCHDGGWISASEWTAICQERELTAALVRLGCVKMELLNGCQGYRFTQR